MRDFYRTQLRTQPLGLAYLAASLRQHGHSVQILDCQTNAQRRAPVPDALRHLEEHYIPGDQTPFRLYGHFYSFGMSPEDIRARIIAARPDIVGLQCQFTPYIDDALRVAALVKSIDNNIPVIAGGAHASCQPERMLADRSIDYVVIGEGEQTLPQLIECLQKENGLEQIQGLAYRHINTVRTKPRRAFIDNLDQLPLPARDLLDLDAYMIGRQRSTMLLTSRGCPQGCTYCSVAALMGEQLRVRSIDAILEEIRACITQHTIRIFDIEDDNFTWDKTRAMHILEALRDEYGDAGISLTAMNGMSLLSLDHDLLEAMRRAGFLHLDLALGSAAPKKNRQLGREAHSPATNAMLKDASSQGFAVTTYILLGVPGHSIEDMFTSIACLAAQPTMIGPSIFYPSPGTKLYDALEHDVLRQAGNEILLRSSAFSVETTEFSRLDIITLLRFVRWINFIKRFLVDQKRDSRTLGDLQDEARLWWPDQIPHAAEIRTSGLFFNAKAPLEAAEAGRIATAFLWAHNVFYAIRRIQNPNRDLYTYRIIPCATSQRVMDTVNAADELTITAARIKPVGHGSKAITHVYN
jgi:anaerobic magnesium-protoporphyrin IX monomethyl ester cyclase